MPERRLDEITPEEVFRSVLERSGADDIVREELEPLFAEALEAGRELMREADARRAEIVSDLAGRGAHQDNEIDAKESGHAALETQN